MPFSDLCKRMDRQIMMVIDIHVLVGFPAQLELPKHSFFDPQLRVPFDYAI